MMQPGRELDALVAEKVMQKRVSRKDEMDTGEPCILSWDEDGDGDPVELIQAIPRYSTDIAAAWEVVEKLQQVPIPDDEFATGFNVTFHLECTYTGIWRAYWAHPVTYFAEGSTAPHAICRAALKAAARDVLA